MPLSLNEIRDRAVAFASEWADAKSESADAKSFWDAFFNVFGITRRRVAAFEVPVQLLKNGGKTDFGRIDLLWKGKLLVEHKSRGKDLDRAHQQAVDYFSGLREEDLPQYVLVSDFARFRLCDLVYRVRFFGHPSRGNQAATSPPFSICLTALGALCPCFSISQFSL